MLNQSETPSIRHSVLALAFGTRVSAVTDRPAPTYVAMFRHNVDLMVAAMQKPGPGSPEPVPSVHKQ
jgi:hypothetical protein